MENNSIKQKIDDLYQELDAMISSGLFVYDKHYQEIFDTIIALQDECAHKFVDGECEYCHRLERK